MIIDVVGVTKRFGAFTALDRLDLSVGEGELVALLGPSGSGKTTLLRVIAGLEIADEGRVLFGGAEAARSPRDRKVGFVFQHYALFRHMTVAANVAFGLDIRPRALRPSRAEIAQRVGRLLALVQLDPLADRYPSQLSGGQRQRVALARALAIEPRVLLLDEPFGALDAKVRKELRRWLRRLHETMRMTTVFVTHDQDEALELADRVVVLNHGRIEQTGTPAELYAHPATAFVLDFLGEVSRLPGLAANGLVRLLRPDVAIGAAEGVSGPVVVHARPQDIEVAPVGDTLGRDGAVPARAVEVRTLGPVCRVDLDIAGEMVAASGPVEAFRGIVPGTAVSVRFRRAFVFGSGVRPSPLVGYDP